MSPSPRSHSVLVLVLAALWAANGVAARSQTPQDPRRRNVKPALMQGKQTFASSCASCHGLDARGGERAPNIAENPRVRRLSDAQIFHIIENGIPGAGMPAFHSLESSNIKAVVTYLRGLQGTKRTVQLPGNPDRGEAIFFGKAACSSCHMVAGKGGFIASDLSGYAGPHAVEEIRNAITGPTSNDRQARLVTATTRSGEKVAGRIRNEDNFSLQLQMLDGTFHFMAKSDLAGLEYNAQALMPSDYGATLSPDELNDIVSYLMRMANRGEKETPKKPDEWDE